MCKNCIINFILKFSPYMCVIVLQQHCYKSHYHSIYYCVFCCSRFTKPQTFADCIGNELPLGWEEAYDKHVGAYYINHVNRKYSLCFCYLVGKVQFRFENAMDLWYGKLSYSRFRLAYLCVITLACARLRVISRSILSAKTYNID